MRINCDGGKTTHDMNGAWWNKYFIVEAWDISSLPKVLWEGSSPCSPMTRITLLSTGLFSSRRSQLPRVDCARTPYLTFINNQWWEEKNIPKVSVGEYWPSILTVNIWRHICLSGESLSVTQQSFQLCTQPSHTGGTLLIRFPMANHEDVVAANWSWDQGAVGNNWGTDPPRTQRWIVVG